MINVESKEEGVIASLINQGIEQGIGQGEKNIIIELLKKYSIDEISRMIDRKPTEIYHILDSD